MKTRREVEQELVRLERLVPHIINDQRDRAQEILGFHVATLLYSAAPAEQALIRARTVALTERCRCAATDEGPPSYVPQLPK